VEAQSIQYELAAKKGLTLKQTFVKREATTTDVLVILRTLWGRARNIPCTESDRVTFHSIILASAIGGFRPETLMSLPYEQVSLAVVRDPTQHRSTKLVATVTVHHNKRHEHVARDAQDET
jgi:hypothetical protein